MNSSLQFPTRRRTRRRTFLHHPLIRSTTTTTTTTILLLLFLLSTTTTTLLHPSSCGVFLLVTAVTIQGQTYPYMKPEPTDERSPCPALNTLANHGFIPRNGKNISVTALALAAMEVYSLSDQSIESMMESHIQRGMPHRRVPTVGTGPGGRPGSGGNDDFTIWFDLSDTHVLDHDASLTQLDQVFRTTTTTTETSSSSNINTCLIDSLIALANFQNNNNDDMENNTAVFLTPETVEAYLKLRLRDSIKFNSLLVSSSSSSFSVDDIIHQLATQASQLFAISNDNSLQTVDRTALYEWLRYNRLVDNYIPRAARYPFVGRPTIDPYLTILTNGDVSAILYDRFESILRSVLEEDDINDEGIGQDEEEPMCIQGGVEVGVVPPPTPSPAVVQDDNETSSPVSTPSPEEGEVTTPTTPPVTTTTFPETVVTCSMDDETKNNNNNNNEQPTTMVRIATWAQVAPALQVYVDAYHKSQPSSSSSSSPRVELQVFPSIRDLGAEVLIDLQYHSQLYDGFVIPPIYMGALFAKQGLLKLDDLVLDMNLKDEEDNNNNNDMVGGSVTNVSNEEGSTVVDAWKDILTVYRTTLATFGGRTIDTTTATTQDDNTAAGEDKDSDTVELVDRVRMIPLLGGNQLTMFYRKDWLVQNDLEPPRTWSDYIRVAAALHDQPLGPNGENIVGSCLGRQSLEACRQAMKAGGTDGTTPAYGWCHSLSMSYLGMMISSMTQVNGTSTGWAFDEQEEKNYGVDASEVQTILVPLLRPALELMLLYMEQQMKFGAPQELLHDGTLNEEMFRNGTCALTITAQPPHELVSSLNQGMVGVGPIPGSHQVLKDRKLLSPPKAESTMNTNSIDNCTTETCPHGVEDEEFGIINRVPFGSITDLAMGGVSSQVSPHSQHGVQDFFQFMLLNPSVLEGQPLAYQPLRHSQLAGMNWADVSMTSSSTTRAHLDMMENDEILMMQYNELIRSLTTSPGNVNAAIPLRIPSAFEMWSALDNRVHEYLSSSNYTLENREQARIDIEDQWNNLMEVHNSYPGAVSLNVFYEKSLGIYETLTPPDLYIGSFLRYIGSALGAVCLLSSIAMALWVKYYINERVVVASQPMFLWTICAGTFIMGLSIFPFAVEDDITSWVVADASCMGAVWLYAIGFCFVFSALYSKMGRINRTFRLAYNFQRIHIEPKDILIPLVIALPVNMIVILVWNILEPMRWERFQLGDGLEDQFDTSRRTRRDRDEELFYGLELSDPDTFGTCTGRTAIFYFGVLFAFDVTVSMYALIQAYEIRKVSTEYNESVWIGAILAAMLQSWVMGLAVLSLLDDNPKTKYLVKTAVVFSTCMVTLTLVFLPKFGYLRKSWAADQLAWDKAASAAAYQQKLAKQKEQDRNWGRTTIPEEAALNKVEKLDDLPELSVSPVIEQAHPGIRITQSRSRRSAEVQRMKEQVALSDERNRILFERLERLQDTLASQHFDSQMAKSNAPSIHEYHNSFRMQ